MSVFSTVQSAQVSNRLQFEQYFSRFLSHFETLRANFMSRLIAWKYQLNFYCMCRSCFTSKCGAVAT